MDMERRKLRHRVRIASAVMAALILPACSPQGYFELDNRSGQDVIVDTQNGPQPAPVGKLTGRIPLAATKLRAGDCTYVYSGLAISGATPREEHSFLSTPAYTYHVRLERDFSLRLFSIADNAPGAEVVAPGWPARPQVDCRTKG